MTTATTVRTIEWANSYGVTIQDARKPTDAEAAKVAEWFRPAYLIVVGDKTPELKHLDIVELVDMLGAATHAFRGCDNRVWIITAEQEAAIVALNDELAAAEQARRANEKPAPKEWLSPRGLTLSEEMDRADSDY